MDVKTREDFYSRIQDEEYYIWGTGELASGISQSYINELNTINLIGYIDNDTRKWGSVFYGKEIYMPDILKTSGKKNILIATVYKNDIIQQINQEYIDCQYKIIDESLLKKMQILSRYKNSKDKDISITINYLKSHELQVFNYEFTEKYPLNNLQIDFDNLNKLYFTMLDDKKMYFARSLDTKEKVKKYYRAILIEQDLSSPHRYLTDSFNVPDNAVVVDAGVAEGNFSLTIVERVKKIYMFEPDKEWYEALQYTFEPYKDKVIIINKCLSNYINEYTTTLDESLGQVNVDFIKMDIEGEEYHALQGAHAILTNSPNIKCDICTYHQELAYQAIKSKLEKTGFRTTHSKGYMWYPEHFNTMRPPVLRRGLIRAEKTDNN